MLTFCDRLLIGFFLSNLDVTIVSSSLTSMTDDLKGFEKRSWIVTGYLATYTGMTLNLLLSLSLCSLGCLLIHLVPYGFLLSV
jgi:MFS family permease